MSECLLRIIKISLKRAGGDDGRSYSRSSGFSAKGVGKGHVVRSGYGCSSPIPPLLRQADELGKRILLPSPLQRKLETRREKRTGWSGGAKNFSVREYLDYSWRKRLAWMGQFL